MLKEGDTAPDFTLNDSFGNPVTLSNFKGKKVVIYFYPKDNTPGCTKEACGFRDEWELYRKKDVVVLGVSPDSEKSHQKFLEKYQLPFTLLSDPEKKVLKMYQAWGEKKMYGKTSVGVIRSTALVDENGKIKKLWKKVNTSTHAQDVLKAIE